MDKSNYTLTNEEMQALKSNIGKIKQDVINELEKKNIIKRKRIITHCSILFIAILHYFVDNLSFQRLADFMFFEHNIKMSDTAWKKQFNKAAAIFFNVISIYVQNCISSDIERTKTVYALDATHFGKSGFNSSATVVHAQVELTNGACVYTKVTDMHISENVNNFLIEENALYVADRAYGKSSQLSYLLNFNADFLIRIGPTAIKLYEDICCTKRIDMKKLSQGDEFSIVCYIKHKKTYQIRVIGCKIPESKQLQAEKRVRRNAVRKQHKITDETISYSKWLFLATSLTEETPENLLLLYRKRWMVELFFKRAKTLLRFHKIRRSNEDYTMSVTKLWCFSALVISAFQICIYQNTKLNISMFNLFSLGKLIMT